MYYSPYFIGIQFRTPYVTWFQHLAISIMKAVYPDRMPKASDIHVVRNRLSYSANVICNQADSIYLNASIHAPSPGPSRVILVTMTSQAS